MSKIELNLEQSLELANKEGARPDVRVLGALSAAAILTHQHGDEFDSDMITAITNVLVHLDRQINPEEEP